MNQPVCANPVSVVFEKLPRDVKFCCCEFLRPQYDMIFRVGVKEVSSQSKLHLSQGELHF
jgi:hypothetical protein